MKKSIKLEARTWSALKDRKKKKENGEWETFAEVVARLLEVEEGSLPTIKSPKSKGKVRGYGTDNLWIGVDFAKGKEVEDNETNKPQT